MQGECVHGYGRDAGWSSVPFAQATGLMSHLHDTESYRVYPSSTLPMDDFPCMVRFDGEHQDTSAFANRSLSPSK